MSPPAPAAPFLLVHCQVGMERALKEELAHRHPSLRPAFGRPGLVTFKAADEEVGPAFALRSVFARTWAAALGPADGIAAVLAIADAVRAGAPLRLHVYPRAGAPGDEAVDEAPPGPPQAGAIPDLPARTRAALLAADGGRFLDGDRAEPGEHVLHVLTAPGEPFFVGHHLHGPGRTPHPGGALPVTPLPDPPSRAWRKLEEALLWSGLPLSAGQMAVEIGSAPGGASYALLRRGLRVVGVDPGAMHPAVLNSPRFQHLQVPLGALRLEDLPPRVDWLLLDVNLAPQVALRAVRGVLARLRPSLRGVVFTLKLNDAKVAARIPELLRRVEEMGLREVRATQLPANRSEICVVAEHTPRPRPARRASGGHTPAQ